MLALNDQVRRGRILYLGISDTPAWIVAKANTYARCNGLRPFVVYQGQWSAADRSFEREILPMCRAEGMGIAPWGALGGGMFKTEAQFQEQVGRKDDPTENQKKISRVLETIATRKKTRLTSIALAYVLHKAPYVFPIVGGRNIDHLKSNIEALGLQLSREEIVEIDDAVPFSRGFPYDVVAPTVLHDEISGPEDLVWNKSFAHIDQVEKEKPRVAGQHVSIDQVPH